MNLSHALFGLYRLASTSLPSDVEEALRHAGKIELHGSPARFALDSILENIKIARERSIPLCQDTGAPVFYVSAPRGKSHAEIERAILRATSVAAKKIPLRPNAVESISGKNTGSGTGKGTPEIHISEWNRPAIRFALLMKGAGSENIGRCYALPDASLNAARDLCGVEKCVLDAVFRAQGKGCPPMVAGVAIGGSRGAVALESKAQLLRRLGKRSKNPRLAELERGILSKSNSLGIGPAGLGGKNTLLAVHASALARHPASYFVDISFSCWALRRRSMTYAGGEAKYE
ncbi:MAG: fumarate hydratase [Candidatus Diapherotrites archaeon]